MTSCLEGSLQHICILSHLLSTLSELGERGVTECQRWKGLQSSREAGLYSSRESRMEEGM